MEKGRRFNGQNISVHLLSLERVYTAKEVLYGRWGQPLTAFPPYAQEALSFMRAWWSGEEYFTIHSSGSTGKPKPLLLSRKQMCASAYMTLRFLQPHKRLPFFLSLSAKVIGGCMMLVRAMCEGRNIHVAQPSAKAIMSRKGGQRYGLAAFVPLQLHEAHHRGTLNELEAFEYVLVGGASLLPSLEKALSQLSHNNIPHLRHERNGIACSFAGFITSIRTIFHATTPRPWTYQRRMLGNHGARNPRKVGANP